VSLHFLHVLAGCEVLAAAAFLWRRVEVFAAAGLLLVFAVASLHVLRNGQAPVHLVFYAATVCWLLYLRRAEHAAIRGHDVRAP
jgi:hypothetical protein